MAKYTYGYLTDDGKFFLKSDDAKRYELEIELKYHFAKKVSVITNEQLDQFINALLERYEVTERYRYDKPE